MVITSSRLPVCFSTRWQMNSPNFLITGKSITQQNITRKAWCPGEDLTLRLIEMIKKEQWSMMSADLKSTNYRVQLEKNGEDTMSGAEQYFTPRSFIYVSSKFTDGKKPCKTLIRAMLEGRKINKKVY